MDYDTILTSVKKQIVVLEEAFASVASRLLISFKNVLSTLLMRQFNVLQLLILQRLIPVLLKEWLPNADDVIKAVKKSYV
jgi:pyruvate dehydrogenase E1 component beta subunit